MRLILGLQFFAISSLQAGFWNSAWKSVKKQAANLANDPAVQQLAGTAALKGLEFVSQKINDKNTNNNLALEAAAGLVGIVQATVEAKLNNNVPELTDGLEQETDRALVNLGDALDPNADQQAVAQQSAEILEIAAEVLTDLSPSSSAGIAETNVVGDNLPLDGGAAIGLPPVQDHQADVVLNDQDLQGAFGPGEYQD